MPPFSRRRSKLPPHCAGRPSMFDLGTSFLASVSRDPKAVAVVDGDIRLSYRDWYAKISAVVGGFAEVRLAAGGLAWHAAATPRGRADCRMGCPSSDL